MQTETTKFMRIPSTEGQGCVTKYLVATCVFTVALLSLGATPALAYPERVSGSDPSGTSASGCPSCHGLESGATSVTVAPREGDSDGFEAGTDVGTRKGPHGGYTPGTQKCVTCHVVHSAENDLALLPEATIAATCFTCHDGTGGGGVYGVIKQRTGFDPAEVDPATGQTAGGVHRIGYLNDKGKVDVPGGKSDGSSLSAAFTGENGSLTCTDCHSPHDTDTVAPFLGDRVRSTADTSSVAIKTNRLLKQRPTSAETTSTEYGSDWCESCHKGRHSQKSTMGNHPAADSETAPDWNYNQVSKLAGFGVSAVTTGSLGGDNFGYVMPEPRGLQPYPICQQCHEDARNVGDDTQFRLSPATEKFSVSVDGVSEANPRFQNFPHESANDRFVIESGDDLCLNCHVAR